MTSSLIAAGAAGGAPRAWRRRARPAARRARPAACPAAAGRRRARPSSPPDRQRSRTPAPRPSALRHDRAARRSRSHPPGAGRTRHVVQTSFEYARRSAERAETPPAMPWRRGIRHSIRHSPRKSSPPRRFGSHPEDTKTACQQAVLKWRDPDSNRGHPRFSVRRSKPSRSPKSRKPRGFGRDGAIDRCSQHADICRCFWQWPALRPNLDSRSTPDRAAPCRARRTPWLRAVDERLSMRRQRVARWWPAGDRRGVGSGAS